YRLGSWIPAPGVDSDRIKQVFGGQGGTLLGFLNVFSGGALSQFSLFALGIMPYVTASIILQLLTVVIPKLEELQKEGEAGMARSNQYTRSLATARRAAQDKPVHALPDRRPRSCAGDRVRLPVQARGCADRELGSARPDRRHSRCRDDAADVDGRADHEARDRQRDLAADL